jgi:transglutaminase-like putative cysteine protease
MMTFRIKHRTRYNYDRSVAFGVHSLMIRPRDAHDMRILDSSLAVRPQADVRWAFDTFGNSVALLTFHKEADELVIASELELRRYGYDEPVSRIEQFAGDFPVRYDPEDTIDLGPLMMLLYPQDQPAVEAWITKAIPELPARSLQVLDALVGAVHGGFRYRRRETYGVQSPAETITEGSGTCRDFAVLFMEAARVLGFAARFVTGYLYDPNADGSNGEAVSGGGATHAWADIFVPGAGWVEFDPTNRIVAGRNLIRVATTRSPAQAVPVSGSFRHDGGALVDMDVQVSVTRLD